MTFSDYMIIYFSAGAPFAVFAFLQRSNRSLVLRLAYSAVTSLAWPVTATIFIYHRFFHTTETPEHVLDHRIQGIRDRMEQSIRRDGVAISVQEWRQTFERYIGLTLAIAEMEDQSDSHELFEVAGNKNGKLGTVCLNRRNRSRLLFHHTDARNEFLDALIRAGRRRDSLDLAIELADLLNDADALSDLMAMRAEQKSVRTPVIDMEQEVWNPPTPKPHIANRV
ncbi:MAG TPA: hypothetical protein VL325_04550 [Pyrinomonadaceae bacterium]|nr:hypothetical protein [Pyrinomonadaceae bacterium]